MKDETFEKGLASVLVYFILILAKWFCLVIGVFLVAITIALAVMSIIKGSGVPSLFLAQITSFISGLQEGYVLDMIKELGMVQVEVAVIGYSFAAALFFCLVYVLISRFIRLYNSIYSGNMFTKENVDLINGSIPLSLIVTFAPAVIIFCIVETIGVFNSNHIIIGGILFVCVSFILKLIFEKGYEIEKKNSYYDKQLSELKAQEDQLKMEAIKMEATLKDLKEKKKESTVSKKDVKKQEKKVSSKKDKKEDNKKPVKKETVKKETKKVNTKKTTKK